MATKAVVLDKIENAKAGDVLVGDGSGKIEPEYVGLDLATKPDQHVQAIDLPFVTTVDQVRALAKAEKEFPTSTRPPESPKQGDVWAYPMKAAPWVVQMLWDKVSGWSIPLEGDPTQFREVRGTDLTADYWEAAELQKIIDQARPRKPLFGWAR